MLKFCIKVFKTSFISKPLDGFGLCWYDDRHWSKILLSTISTPIHDLKIKVTDLELSC